MKDSLLPEVGIVTSQTYTHLVNNLTTEIKNSFSQECGQTLVAKNMIQSIDGDGNEAHGVSQKAYVQGMRECMMTSVMASDAATKLQNFIEQESKTVSTGPIAGLIKALTNPLVIFAIVAGVLLFVLAPLFGGTQIITKTFTNKYFIIGAVILVVFLVIVFAVIKPMMSSRDKKEKEDEK